MTNTIIILAVDGMPSKPIMCVHLEEEMVHNAKLAIKEVLQANHHGPTK